METIEKLTDEERAYIQGFRAPEATKALRIIDQLTAALEAAERDGAETYDRLMTAHDRQRARAEALQARVAELEGWYARAMRDVADLNKSRGAADAELADLRGRVERAEAYLQAALEALHGR